MKYTFIILLSLFFSWSSLTANPTDKNNKTKEASKDKNKSTEDLQEDEESFFIMEQKVDKVVMHKSERKTNSDDPDSSYYSVNKFNYLFYYLYKIKYLGIEEDIDIEP